jgi:subtilisin family serine protease
MRRLALLAVAAAAAAALAGGPAAAVRPNDPAWDEQWAARQIGLPAVWSVTTGDPRVVVAVVDTGVNELPDLAGAVLPGWDFVDDDADARDTHGHGTQVATVIAARGNNGAGMAGHCWRCSVLPVRVSAAGSARPERIAAGIRWAVEHGARVVNVSLTRTGAPEPVERDAVAYALGRGVLIVASAGNDGNEVPQYPAAYSGVLAVAATTDSDSLYFWSTRGPWVALAAPGCQMVLAGGPGTLCGTSFTPAAVAGVAGLILSRAPHLTAAQVTAALTGTAKPVAGVTAGRVDAAAAFARLGLAPPAPSRPPSVSAPAPGQRFAKAALLRSGTFRGGMRVPLRVGRGRLELQLATPRAVQCALTLRSPGEVVLAAPALRNLLSLSVRVARGRHVVEVRCAGRWPRRYTLGVMAMFPLPSD